MKKIMLVSMIAAAAMFTACDDDSTGGGSGKVYSCDINIDLGALGSMRTCVEASDQAKVSQACSQVNESMKALGAGEVGKVGSSCPSGSTKTCSGEEDGVSYTAYFYDEESASASCDELLSDKDELGF